MKRLFILFAVLFSISTAYGSDEIYLSDYGPCIRGVQCKEGKIINDEFIPCCIHIRPYPQGQTYRFFDKSKPEWDKGFVEGYRQGFRDWMENREK